MNEKTGEGPGEPAGGSTDKWLILETSGRVARVGLARAGAIVRAAELDSARRHARELVPAVETMLKAESLRPTDLTGIMVSCGPGSYTGLRVGLATAKAFAYATGRQLRAVDTFAAIAVQFPVEVNDGCVIADALQEQVYVQEFARRDNDWLPTNALRILAVSEFVGSLPAGTWIGGPGVLAYEARIPAANPRLPEVDRDPRLESVFAVGLRLPSLTKEELFALEPLYLRGSSAEEKAKITVTQQ